MKYKKEKQNIEDSLMILDEESDELMKMAFETFGLTARSYDRILKVARTIADLSESEDICPEHISEAAGYRFLDRQNII